MTDYKPTLWDTESAWVEAFDRLNDAAGIPEQETEALAVYEDALRGAVEKRERVAAFVRHVDARIDYLKAEEVRLRERRKVLENGRARLFGFIQQVMESLGLKKMEGESSTFTICQNASAPLIVTALENAIPARFFRIPPPELDRKALADAVKAGDPEACAVASFGERGTHLRMR